MSFNIAVAGKGGSGKTSLASLVIRYLKNSGTGPILAVDADANANLGESLGLTVRQTVGKMLDEFQGDKINIPPGMTKELYLDFKLNEILVESPRIDLLTMGRGEGPECYCYPNVILKKFADTLADNYAYMVMDNEAGMEHLSRRTTQDVDVLFLVSNHSVKGVRTIARIIELVSSLKLTVKKLLPVISAAPDELDPLVKEELERQGIELAAIIPKDEEVYRYDLELRPLLELPDTSPAVQVVRDLMEQVLDQTKISTR
ncbi:MAG TPA: AAA family ATPase [Dehalococcoidales bacterium]|nr:AAA family ATPase [Dehalococcoidales bacterium]